MEIARPRALRPLHRIGLSGLFLWAALVMCSFFSGCAAPAQVQPAAPPLAHLVVINETDYAWQLTLTRVTGQSAHGYRLQPRATLSLDLVGDDYVIEQTALAENGAVALSRKVPARLDAGQTYRWRLATLLSESTAPADHN